uniref:cholinesterase-like isoform X1 n=1 Tax=Oncorhynchus gorbuscha TaxID=8017 RepID=UPI001EAF48A9|nr:cholinesterase-like isoform X1 [Oncorhynchus gorbuscha]XP_046172146.1 cholinesterase-like isoform X1 [Oncorhynchus gorbuscha]XP_046172147.1 cholinesterase-like isoform X1 [Oncorhynchus gorbuscha]
MVTTHTHITLSLLLFHILPATTTQVDDLIDDVIVATDRGRVRGTRLPVPGGGYVRAFLGIPYGNPPVGELRFRPPQPADGWTGVLHATRYPNSCLQPQDTLFPGFRGAEMWNPNTKMSEDCLYLNIWTPPPLFKTHPKRSKSTSPGSSLAPVMVWIYGGGFTTGTASLDLYDGQFLSQSEGVVVVSMNYRLGPLGFLSLPESEGVRGNAGMLDQRLALYWVANNIAAFGGDPSKVTLFGESAGSASVGLHLLSPGSHGLFNRAILQSGSPNTPWAVMTQQQAWNRSLSLGRLLGCPLAPLAVLEQCLQRAHPEDIIKQQYNVLSLPTILALPFTPSVDQNFLPDMPEVLLRTGHFLKTEVLIGLNQDEGTYFLVYGAPGYDITSQSLISRENFLKGVDLVLPGFSDVMRETAIFQYTDWTDENSGMKNRDLLGRMLGDHDFNCPVLEFAQRYTEHGGKARLFLFDHHSSTNPWPAWMGVMHGYEIEFVFGMPLNRTLGYLEEEVVMSRRMMKYWANMARTGNPSIEEGDWPLFTVDQQEYITLNSSPPHTQKRLAAHQCQFWNNFLPKLQEVTVSVGELEQQWRNHFHRWMSYMLEWKNDYSDHSLSSPEGQKQQDCDQRPLEPQTFN